MTHELEKLQRKGTERKQGHSKLVYDKATRTIKTIDPHPESNPTCPHCKATVLSTSQPEGATSAAPCLNCGEPSDELFCLTCREMGVPAALTAPPSGTQGALALYLNEVQPVDGRVQLINISLDELSVLRRLVAANGQAVQLQARRRIYDAWTDIYPAQVEAMSTLGYHIRATESPAQRLTAAAPAVGGEAAELRLANTFNEAQLKRANDEIKRLRDAAPPASPLRGIEMDLKTSEEDESLMRATLLKCYSEGPYAFRVSKEHYLYLAEQIIALREGSRRMAAASPLRGRQAIAKAAQVVVDRVNNYDDRTSPEDWPDALLITSEELHSELMRFAEDISALAPELAAAEIIEPRTAAGSLD